VEALLSGAPGAKGHRVILLKPPQPPTARVYIRPHEAKLMERRVAQLRQTAAAFLGATGEPPPDLLASIQLQALARVTDLPADLLFGEKLEILIVPDEQALPGKVLEDKAKPLPGSGRLQKLAPPLVVLV